MTPAIAARGLGFRYPGTDSPQLSDFDLTVAQSSCTALVGPSGCAKTTVLRLLAGLEQPTAGTIDLAGQRVAGPGVFLPAEHRRVGLVFQDYALFPHLTVARNIAFGLHGSRRQDKAQRVAELLSVVGLEGYEKRYPHQLSGGQQQRVALARALAPHPHVLLLDEPFSNLDADLRAQVREEIAAILHAHQITSVLVTHDDADALALADTTVRMRAPRR